MATKLIPATTPNLGMTMAVTLTTIQPPMYTQVKLAYAAVVAIDVQLAAIDVSLRTLADQNIALQETHRVKLAERVAAVAAWTALCAS